MAEFASSGDAGLRERKKRRTRSTLVDVASDLCLRQGYDNTTVEQIAAAAEVSPRTFSRYFPTKDSVIAAMAEEMDDYVAAALIAQPPDISEHEALLRAHLEIFSPAGPSAPAAFNCMAVLIQIVNSSATLNTSPFHIRQTMSKNAAVGVIAQRMGLPWDHPTVKLVADTWTVLFASSFIGLGTPGNDPIEAALLCKRLEATFEVYRRLGSAWQAEAQPPAGASRG